MDIGFQMGRTRQSKALSLTPSTCFVQRNRCKELSRDIKILTEQYNNFFQELCELNELR